MSHRGIPNHTCDVPHFIPSSPHLLGFLGVLKAQRIVVGKRLNLDYEPSKCSPKVLLRATKRFF
jgi:hypothetical protein